MNDKTFNRAEDDRHSYQDAVKEAQQFFRIQGLKEFPIHAGPAEGWRCRAKLAVRGSVERPLIGLFKEGTHDVIDMVDCPDHHPAINEALELVRQIFKEEGIPPYDEQKLQGMVRYLQFVVHRPSNKVQLTLVVNRDDGTLKQFPWLEKLWNQGKEQLWHSIWLNFNGRSTNTIFGPKWLHCYGPDWLWETFSGIQVCFHPSSFGQANLDLFEEMTKHIQHVVNPDSRVVEYYAGVGAIGLCLAEQARQLICCEINPQAKQCFEQSKHKLKEAIQSKLSYQVGSAGQQVDLLEQAETVIVDPPRKGLELPLLQALNQDCKASQLIYISCGWDSFQRDCQQLIKGGWRLTEAYAYLFFPGTKHIETLALFTK